MTLPVEKKRGRAPLRLPPTIGTIEAGRDAYVPQLLLRELVYHRDAERYWSLHGIPSTVAITHNRFIKSWDRFTDHQEEAQLETLLREYAECGVPRPSGYADVFHARYKTPYVCWTHNAMLSPAFCGGWQQALKPGSHRGVFRGYDMRSAYLWALTLGLPDPATYRASGTIDPNRKGGGVYRVRLENPVADAPFPFNRKSGEVLASAEEIEAYNLPIAEVIAGVTWDGLIDPEPLLSALRAVSTWKQAGRSYWGRWGQTERVECTAGGKTWTIPNRSANVPWAHVIVSRVKQRLWDFSSDALHVFVDSCITPHEFPVNDKIGSWRLDTLYPDGVVIKGPGQYRALHSGTWTKYAGVPKNAPARIVDQWADSDPDLLAS